MIHDLNFLILTCLHKIHRFSQFQLMNLVRLPHSSTPISHTSAAAFHSAFTSVIGRRTDMHKVLYVLHKVEWNSVGTDIVSTKHNV